MKFCTNNRKTSLPVYNTDSGDTELIDFPSNLHYLILNVPEIIRKNNTLSKHFIIAPNGRIHRMSNVEEYDWWEVNEIP